MALRDQPYMPLYVQDFMTDEKLMECSPMATGIYIRVMCIMHKSEEYGKILLKQKDKQSGNQIKDFALKVARFLPYDLVDIHDGLDELLASKVLQIDGDYLIQKRMVKDNNLSIKRSSAGSKGGKTTQFAKAKSEANTEYEIEDVNDSIERLKSFKYLFDRRPGLAREGFNSVKKYLETNFEMHIAVIKKNYPKYEDIIKDFEESNIQGSWKDGQDLKRHFTNYCPKWKPKPSTGSQEFTENQKQKQEDFYKI
ncbi:MAG: hypothetical protein JWQ09_4395 [Segetibacter sp.]|nr:hypothetical protein [Segetibacter sp.]